MRKLFLLAAGLAVLLSTGCASIVSKSNYPVTISSNLPNATITVKKLNTKNVVATGKSPLLVTLKASNGFFDAASYVCKATAPGKKSQYRQVNAQIDPWFFGNLFLGGIIGVAIDGATGAMFKLEEEIFISNFD